MLKSLIAEVAFALVPTNSDERESQKIQVIRHIQACIIGPCRAGCNSCIAGSFVTTRLAAVFFSAWLKNGAGQKGAPSRGSIMFLRLQVKWSNLGESGWWCCTRQCKWGLSKNLCIFRRRTIQRHQKNADHTRNHAEIIIHCFRLQRSHCILSKAGRKFFGLRHIIRKSHLSAYVLLCALV